MWSVKPENTKTIAPSVKLKHQLSVSTGTDIQIWLLISPAYFFFSSYWYHHLTTLRGGGWRRTGRCWLTQTQEQPTPGLSWCSTHGLSWCSTHGLLFSQNCWTAGVGGQKLFWQCPKRWDDIYKVASLTLLWGIPRLFYTCFHVVHINGNCLCIKGVIPGKREALLWNLFVLHFSPILWIWQRLHPMHILPTFENIAV